MLQVPTETRSAVWDSHAPGRPYAADAPLNPTYPYGPRRSRILSSIAISAVSALLFLWLLKNNLQGVAIFFIPLPRWLARYALIVFALGLVSSAFYNLALLVRRTAFPQFLTITPTELTFPISNWNESLHSIPLAAVEKVIGPRADQLEIRTRDESYFLDAGKFTSAADFLKCCAEIHERLGKELQLASKGRPAYKKIADRFTVGRMRSHVGHVIASPDALFLVVLKNDPRKGAFLVLLSERFSQVIGKLFGQVACEMPLTDLPDEILDHPEWPLWEREGTVFILPKAAVTSIRWPWLGELEVKTAEKRFNLGVSFFDRREHCRYLRATGWKV